MRKNFRFPKILSIALVFIIAVIFYACEDFSEVGTPPTLGTQIDFSRVVAIGNSITAGYQDGALFEGAQQYSYPNLIVQQINKTFGTNITFVQPLIAEPGFGTRLRLTSLTPLQIQSQPVTGSPRNSAHAAPFNNLAVPGAILFDMFDTTDYTAKAGPPRNNPFFQIVLRSRTLGPTMFHQARALNPTFVFFWMGNNDVLGYASSGGTRGTDPTGKLPTPEATFQLLFRRSLDSLLRINTTVRIAVANIPDVTVIPFFTTVPWFVVDPNTGQPVRDAQGNLIPLTGVKGGTPRPLGPGDLVLLPASQLISTGYGLPPVPPFNQLPNAGKPLPDDVVLDASEVNIARTAIQRYNFIIDTVIASSARAGRVVKVDIFSKLNEVKAQGLEIAGFKFTTDFITGGLFSLDGIHPSTRGHAIIANEFIKAINGKFGSNIPLIDVMSLPGIQLPTSGNIVGKYQIPKVPAEVWKNVVELFTAR
ncbi:MAG: SGNH/GDSL hydrolase family protein [Candidatus Kryptonium sp.]|nr:SGNH/GDSL hydrolase family protein [Candidatus Kryptonium sp.]MCX7763193.1 SGNH/GDSL hydrolase family protein [Candidatus Kryptonium sp.]MDW8109193.1 SGNH/GDSL hydrolase family protein [Candidatus Kryptonium sp.]